MRRRARITCLFALAGLAAGAATASPTLEPSAPAASRASGTLLSTGDHLPLADDWLLRDIGAARHTSPGSAETKPMELTLVDPCGCLRTCLPFPWPRPFPGPTGPTFPFPKPDPCVPLPPLPF